MNQLRIFLWIFALIHSADASGNGTNGYPEDVFSDPTSGHFEYANTNAQRQTGQQGMSAQFASQTSSTNAERSGQNPPLRTLSSLSDSERIRQRTKNTLASGAPLLNAYHGNLNQYGAPQGRTKKLLQSLSNLQGEAYSVSEASQKILHYGNDAHYELLQYQGQLDREKSQGKLNEQQYNERLQTAKDAMKYLTKLREASAEYQTLRENRPANK